MKHCTTLNHLMRTITLSFSKSLVMPTACLSLFLHRYNLERPSFSYDPLPDKLLNKYNKLFYKCNYIVMLCIEK
jgi:hypothetical protein